MDTAENIIKASDAKAKRNFQEMQNSQYPMKDGK